MVLRECVERLLFLLEVDFDLGGPELDAVVPRLHQCKTLGEHVF